MRLVISYAAFVVTSFLCAYPVAWVTTRIRTALFLSGYFSTDPIQLRYLWIFFSLLLLAGGWIQMVPPSPR
jgi:hypothetical protein